ncbi:TPA: NUDIX hydrolase [Bacillus cereus]|nr:NUDIX hydrolase [Bacillus cereus]
MEGVKVVYALIKNKYNQILMVDNHEGHWSLPAVNEAKFLNRNCHAIVFTFEAQIIGGTEEIKMPQEILQIEWVNIEQANKRMPYYTEGIHKLMQGCAYNNQGTVIV